MSIQQPPGPPPISPRQMDILRAVTAMAWSDGHLEPDEIRVMLDEFALLFGKDEAEQQNLKKTLREYLTQNIPLEEIIPHISRVEDRKMVLRLSYQVIQSSRRNPNEPMVNMDEAAAYQRLLRMLDLPKETVEDIEASVVPPDPNQVSGFMQALAGRLHHLMQHH